MHRRKAAPKVRKSCGFGRKPSKIVEISRTNGAESEEMNMSGQGFFFKDAYVATSSQNRPRNFLIYFFLTSPELQFTY